MLTWIYGHMYAWLCGGQRSTLSIFLGHFPAYVLRKASHRYLELTDSAKLASQEVPLNPPVSASLKLGLQICMTPGCFTWVLGIKLGSSDLWGKSSLSP